MFKLPESFYEKQREINELKYITVKGDKIHVTELEDESVTPEYYEQMRMNSYARDDIFPKLTNESLLKAAKSYLSNCSRPRIPCATYDEALVHKIVPELIKRLERESRYEKD